MSYLILFLPKRFMLCKLFSTLSALNPPPQSEHILLILNNVPTLGAIDLYADRRFDEKY
jgi:hypothetical protein